MSDVRKWGELIKIVLMILRRANLIDKSEFDAIQERLSGANPIENSARDVADILFKEDANEPNTRN